MRGTLRRLFIALLILAALVALAYQSRHKIHLADFTWRKFIHSVGQANIWLLLLSLGGDLRVLCDPRGPLAALLPVCGPHHFSEYVRRHADGLRLDFRSGARRRACPAPAAGAKRSPAGSQHVRNFLSGALLRFCCGRGSGLPEPARVSEPALRRRRGHELGGRGAARRHGCCSPP